MEEIRNAEDDSPWTNNIKGKCDCRIVHDIGEGNTRS